jgi:eukaryotic-like serine/threonine-protein kinase
MQQWRSYLSVNRLDEARSTAQEAQAHNLDNPANHLFLYSIDFLQHDAAGMEREAAGLMGKRGFEDVILYIESDTAAYGGQFSKARELTRRASESAQRADEKETAAGYQAEAAVREALVGNMRLAKQQVQAALALSTGKDVEAISAIALGLAGDSAQARRLSADLAKRFPQDTIVQFNYLPTHSHPEGSQVRVREAAINRHDSRNVSEEKTRCSGKDDSAVLVLVNQIRPLQLRLASYWFSRATAPL